MNKLLTAITVTVGVISMTMTGAFASEYDVENMTLDELKEAVTTLESEKVELEGQVKDLKVQLFDLQQGSDETPETTAETEAPVETEAEKVLKTTEEFLEDIAASYNGRSVIADRYTTAELNSMTEEESIQFDDECAQSELPFYEEYKNASFEDLNIQYLCNQYIQGIEKQLDVKRVFEETGNYEKADSQFTSGYYNRAYVIVELSDYYDLSIGDISGMRDNTAYMDSLNDAETRNAEVDHETVRRTQELLNTIGFFCGNADGISGKRTVKSIKRFQEMYGYDPIDGMIDNELIGQLEEVAAQKAPVEETEMEQ